MRKELSERLRTIPGLEAIADQDLLQQTTACVQLLSDSSPQGGHGWQITECLVSESCSRRRPSCWKHSRKFAPWITTTGAPMIRYRCVKIWSRSSSKVSSLGYCRPSVCATGGQSWCTRCATSCSWSRAQES